MNGVAIFFIVIILLGLLGFSAFTIYTRLRARRLGLPPPSLNPFASSSRAQRNYTFPSPAPGGVIGWVNDKFRALKNRRSATGAYEEPLSGVGGAGGGAGYPRGRRGFGPLDPDEAWDARVGDEAAYAGYEEQELGLHEGGGAGYAHEDTGYHPYTGAGGVTPLGSVYTPPSSGAYEEERRGRSRSREMTRDDPFADENAVQGSLRGVSPRPADEADDRETRRSAFREGL